MLIVSSGSPAMENDSVGRGSQGKGWVWGFKSSILFTQWVLASADSGGLHTAAMQTENLQLVDS